MRDVDLRLDAAYHALRRPMTSTFAHVVSWTTRLVRLHHWRRRAGEAHGVRELSVVFEDYKFSDLYMKFLNISKSI